MNSQQAFAFYLQTGAKKRADERTRTADLLITSDNSCVAGVCTSLQIPHIQGVSSSLACCVLHRIAFPVVSEWCQMVSELPAFATWSTDLSTAPLLKSNPREGRAALGEGVAAERTRVSQNLDLATVHRSPSASRNRRSHRSTLNRNQKPCRQAERATKSESPPGFCRKHLRGLPGAAPIEGPPIG